MAKGLKERKDMDPKYMWDLSLIYKTSEDWEKDLKNAKKEMQKFLAFKGNLNNPKKVKEYLDEFMKFKKTLMKILSYASLKYSEDTRNEKAKNMNIRAENFAVEYNTLVSFFEPEMLSKDELFQKEILNDSDMSEYKTLLSRIFDKRKYTLSEKEERVIASFGEVLFSPQIISSSLEDSDMVFEDVLDKDGKKVPLSGSNFTTLEASTDRVLRKNAFKNYYKEFKNHINTFSSTMSANVKAKVVEASLRGYNSSREQSTLQERVPIIVYDNLIKAVRKHISSMHRYVKLRKEILGVKELHFYDIYAPLVEHKRNYTFEEAENLLYDTVKIFGEDYYKQVKNGIKKKWVDVFPNKGKTGGAFSAGTCSTDPYILMNYTGTLDSVSTLLHEMGHSMHTYLSKKNLPAQYSDYTLFVAEVASTVNENLLIENLLSKTTDKKERLVLLNQYLENFKGTLYRQTMFAEFEKLIHEEVERGGALTPQYLSDLYEGLNKYYFGDEIVFDEEIKYEWARIPHFYMFFYVYNYATSYSAAVALSEGIINEKKGLSKGNIKRYLEFLSMGSLEDPLEELKHAGVDFTTEKPILDALDKFDKVLDEVTNLVEEIKNEKKL